MRVPLNQPGLRFVLGRLLALGGAEKGSGQRNRDILLFRAALVYGWEVARKHQVDTCPKIENVPIFPPWR